MKATEVFFDSLIGRTLFIKAKLLKNYLVYQKTSPRTAQVYGSGKIARFCGTEGVIEVAETSYAELAHGSEFALTASAHGLRGFIVPADILLKLGSHAYCIDMNRKVPERCVHIDSKERVFDLGRTFTFENITVAHLNI